MPAQASNLLLDKLPPDLCARILAASEPVELPIRTSLFNSIEPPRHIHFITSGIASVVTYMENGEGIEVGLVGREGSPEALCLLGPAPAVNDCFIQIAATALRIDYKRFEREFFPLDPVRRVMLQYVQYTTLLTGQIAACNRLHEVEERLSRWLLMVADRIGQPTFLLTQEFLAEMIGSRRSTVTLSAGVLKRSGLITYHRGDLKNLDRENLEDSACECYPISRKLLDSLTR